MGDDDAIRLVREVKALFPCNAEQLAILRGEFLSYPVPAVEAAIREHVKEGDRLSISQLLRVAAEKSAGKQTDWLSVARAERQRSAAEQQEVNATLARLTEQQLQREKSAILAGLRPEARPYLERSDPRRSAVLRCMIYRRVSEHS